jgi:hypothetical protein
MAWLAVKINVPGQSSVDNVVNTDTIVRFGPRGDGSYMRFVDGSSIELLDAYVELIEEIQKIKEVIFIAKDEVS